MDVAERNRKIKLRKQTIRLGAIQQKILLLLLGGVALSCSRSQGKQWQIIKGVHEGWQDIKRQAAERALDAMYESNLVEARKNTDGTHTLLLSKDGNRRALMYRITHIKIKSTKVWDLKWRIVLFDIPEDEREKRDAFRKHLTHLGLRKLQHSAGITPFDCENEIDFIVELLDIKKYVRFIVASHIDNEVYWKRVFKLEKHI